MNIFKKLAPYLIAITFLIPMLSCTAQIPTSGKPKKPKPSDFGIKSRAAMDAYFKGRESDKYRDRKAAVEYYSRAVELEPQFGEAHFRLGLNYYLLDEFEKGIPHFKSADEYYDNKPVHFYYFMGEMLFYTGNYTKAKPAYESFLEDLDYGNFGTEKQLRDFIKGLPKNYKKYLQESITNIRNCEFAESAIKNKVKFEPKNMGENINSVGEEYLANLTADDQIMFYTARRPECTGGYMAEMRGYPEDFFYSTNTDGKWKRTQNLGPPVNTVNNEGAASFSPDGQYVYFTACNRDDGLGSCDIYISRLSGLKWSKPKNLGPAVNSGAWESQPCISNDGNTLYFISTKSDGSMGGHDIWYSTNVNGTWTQAKNLGAPINTPGNEFSPFLHADGRTFYFSSDNHPGFGGLDLFFSKRNANGWGKPENLGSPLNTYDDEQTLFINARGTKGYITSDKEGGYGGFDLYEFALDEKIKPSVTTFVRALVADVDTRKPLDAQVYFINLETRDTVRKVNTNSASGRFLVSLPLEQTYAAFVDAKGYLWSSQNFSLKNLTGKNVEFYDVEIFLEPIKKGAKIVLKNIFYETNKFELLKNSKVELEHIVDFMKQNPKVKIEISGHTDNVGKVQTNLTLSENRAKAVKDYLVGRGVSLLRIISVGQGESMPVADNSTEEGRAENRRTEFKIIGLD